MNKIAKLLTVAGLAVAFSTCASANIVWTLENVDFLGGEIASGTFTTDNSGDTLESYSIAVTGGFSTADFTATHSDSSLLPGEISFYASPFPTLTLDFASHLTSAGGTVHIASASDGILNLDVSNAEVVGVDPPSPTPEPSSILFLAGSVIVMGFLLRRKLVRAN